MDARLQEAQRLARLAVSDEEFHREDGDRLARLVLELGDGLHQQQRTFTFITAALDSMQARPLMWGGKEAIELQYLELLTLWVYLHSAGDATAAATQQARLKVSAEYRRLSHTLLGQTNAQPLSARGVTLDAMMSTLQACRKALMEPVSG